MEKQGAKVSRAIWNGRANESQFTYNVIKMIEQGNNNGQNNIKYTVLKKGTVVPPSQLDNPGSNHINTWRIAYTIEGVRDWLFTQVIHLDKNKRVELNQKVSISFCFLDQVSDARKK